MTENIKDLICIVCVSALNAVLYILLIFPNNFVPCGLDGICTMIQFLFKINIGYLSLIINVPLCILAFFRLNKDFAIKTAIYVVCFSVFSILLKKIPLTDFLQVKANSIIAFLLIAAASGFLRGVMYVFTLRSNGSAGGIDIVAALIKKRFAGFDFMSIILVINVFVIICSFFVFGNSYTSVICSFVYALSIKLTSRLIKNRTAKANTGRYH